MAGNVILLSKIKENMRSKLKLCLLSISMLFVLQSYSQNTTPIKGSVLSENGTLLQGVSIRIENTQNKTIKYTTTDSSGIFMTNITYGQSYNFYFNYVGYSSDSLMHFLINKGEKNSILMRLKEDKNALADIVVVGYGTQKKVNLTGAITQIQGEEIADRAVSNASKSLQGIVPGLNVTVGGNTHPGSSFNLNVRGTGNLSGSDQPYVLVDGVAMSLSDINPQDIESITVLKDAAASAIYGARAPYGVILVTTKAGKKGRMQVKYSNNFGMTTPLKLPQAVNSYEFAKYLGV